MENTKAILRINNNGMMMSKKSKYFQEVYGKTVIERVINTIFESGIEDIIILTNKDIEKFEEKFGDKISCKTEITKKDIGAKNLIILDPDIPLIKQDTINKFIKESKESKVSSLNNGEIEFFYVSNDSIKDENIDIEKIVKSDTVKSIIKDCPNEFIRINNKMNIEKAINVLKDRINREHMKKGVTIEDSATTYIYDDVEIGIDTVIHPNTTIKSGVVIGEECEIGPNSYIREGCKLSDKVKIGSFVEIKKAIIGYGSKVPHLSYMGDSQIGKKCNIGCGTITCNYDGKNKFKTIIGDHSFIGSNTNLVAPVQLGDNTFVAAGSTITQDVPDDSFAIARQRQTNKEGRMKNYKD